MAQIVRRQRQQEPVDRRIHCGNHTCKQKLLRIRSGQRWREDPCVNKSILLTAALTEALASISSASFVHACANSKSIVCVLSSVELFAISMQRCALHLQSSAFTTVASRVALGAKA